jgi:hypothetical protein
LVAVECTDFESQTPRINWRKETEMKRSDDTNIYQNDKSVRTETNQNSNIIGFATFKEKKAENEYKKAINNILARAQKVDW